jgi:hypothetical protein
MAYVVAIGDPRVELEAVPTSAGLATTRVAATPRA